MQEITLNEAAQDFLGVIDQKAQRQPSAKIAGKGQILGDIITPVVPAEDWGLSTSARIK